MDDKSFYDPNYIIDINEKRLDQYTTAYQKVLERLTHIILIYSALTIFLIPIIQDFTLFKINNVVFIIFFGSFIILLGISIVYTVKLILPVYVAYLDFPSKYYQDIRTEYEKTITDKDQIITLLKGSYIEELQKALIINEDVFKTKSAFYYNSLIFALLAVIPYLVCLGFHLSQKNENAKKAEIVNTVNIHNFIKIDTMRNHNKNKKSVDTSVRTPISNLPGIIDGQVIASSPNIIKENSSVSLKKKKK